MRPNRIRTLKKHINKKPTTKQPTTKKQIGGAAATNDVPWWRREEQRTKRPRSASSSSAEEAKAAEAAEAAVVSDEEEEAASPLPSSPLSAAVVSDGEAATPPPPASSASSSPSAPPASSSSSSLSPAAAAVLPTLPPTPPPPAPPPPAPPAAVTPPPEAAAAERKALIEYVKKCEDEQAGPMSIKEIYDNVPQNSIYSALQERIREQYKYISDWRLPAAPPRSRSAEPFSLLTPPPTPTHPQTIHEFEIHRGARARIYIFILHALFNEYYTSGERPIYRLLTNIKNNIEVNYTLNSKYNFKYNDNYNNETINLMSSIMKGASYFNIEYLNLFEDYIEPAGSSGGGGGAADDDDAGSAGGGGGDGAAMSNDGSVDVPNDYLKFINSIMINIRHIEFILYSLPSDYIIEQNKPPYYLYDSYIFLLNTLTKKNRQTESDKQKLKNITDIILADPNIYNLHAVFKPPNIDALFEGKQKDTSLLDLHNHIDEVMLSLLTDDDDESLLND
jgi:hypothetical protein